ncbi:MAG: hypothetical protein RLZZ126_427 [Pseudomonadota bacterium]
MGQGFGALTTARVAQRAGVSVGSVYQYYPNKQALLIAVLERHLDQIMRAMEDACAGLRGKPLLDMAQTVVQTYVAAKLRQPEVSRALYALPSDVATDAIVARIMARGQLAACDMLASCGDARFVEPSVVAAVWTGALMGPVQMMLTGATPLERADAVTRHMTALSTAYLQAVALPLGVRLSPASQNHQETP